MKIGRNSEDSGAFRGNNGNSRKASHSSSGSPGLFLHSPAKSYCGNRPSRANSLPDPYLPLLFPSNVEGIAVNGDLQLNLSASSPLWNSEDGAKHCRTIRIYFSVVTWTILPLSASRRPCLMA